MQATILYGPRDIRFEERDAPTIMKPTDAVIRIAATCVCGSNLWPYRGINAVCPGTIDTPMVSEMLAKEPDAMKEILRNQPIGRLGRAEEIASAVLWLCSPGASFVIGHALVVDGGFTAH